MGDFHASYHRPYHIFLELTTNKDNSHSIRLWYENVSMHNIYSEFSFKDQEFGLVGTDHENEIDFIIRVLTTLYPTIKKYYIDTFVGKVSIANVIHQWNQVKYLHTHYPNDLNPSIFIEYVKDSTKVKFKINYYKITDPTTKDELVSTYVDIEDSFDFENVIYDCVKKLINCL